MMTPRLLGARVRRSEDGRLLTGRGRYVADLRFPGTLHAKFVRSTEAHARIDLIDTEAARSLPGVIGVFTGFDWPGLAIRWNSSAPGYQRSDMPVLPTEVVRHVGEALAIVVAEDEYVAEDAASLVEVAMDPMAVVLDVDDALSEDAVRVHSDWSSNVFVAFKRQSDGFGLVEQSDLDRVDGRWTVGRSSGVPLECRVVVAAPDPVSDRLTVMTTTQIPHLVRTAISEALGIGEAALRVVAPDVGGGFGTKSQAYPEEVAIAAAAQRLGRPVRWIEDRREHLISAHQARESRYDGSIWVDGDGIIAAVACDLIVNQGPYSVFPWSASMETGVALGAMLGPYRIPEFSLMGRAVATNKAPFGAYRGVGRPSAIFALERLVDQAARHLDMDPIELRRRNTLARSEFPYASASGQVYDSGSPLECFEEVQRLADLPALLEDRRRAREAGRLVGIGVVPMIEKTGAATAHFAPRGLDIVFGYETATLRLEPDGMLTVSASVHSQGQGLETSLAQLAADGLGLPIGSVNVRMGDTDQTAYGSGTFASRSAVLGGGATKIAAGRLRDRLLDIAGHVFEAAPQDIDIRDGRIFVVGSVDDGMTIAELSSLVYKHPEKLPSGHSPALEETATYDAPATDGTFSSAAHLAMVEIDEQTGAVQILRYAVVQDCGTMINPAIVEGQVTGGVTQGIGGALLEEFIYDDAGQPLSASFMDYLLPGSVEVPLIQVGHLETPSSDTIDGIKGVGEAGAVAPGAVLASAVEDALLVLGPIVVEDLPMTPAGIRRLIGRAAAQPLP